MSDPWEILRRAGLPLGMPPPENDHPLVGDLALAVERAVDTDPRGRERDALCAFVLAWRRQWPHTFRKAFRENESVLIAWANAAITDPNRHIKLSRIAMAHLAHVL